jgi:hypothetical protein
MKRITLLMSALVLCANMASAQILTTSAKSYAKPPIHSQGTKERFRLCR